jgi:hypothetical protein
MAKLVVKPLRNDVSFGARILGVSSDALTDEAIRRQINDVFEDRGLGEGAALFPPMETNRYGYNWRMLHSVSGCSPDHPRKMHRTTIAGDYGLGYFENDSKDQAILEMTI